MSPAQTSISLDPLTVACPYRGWRYARACRALAGQPCRDATGAPMREHHGERIVAAGGTAPAEPDGPSAHDEATLDLYEDSEP